MPHPSPNSWITPTVPPPGLTAPARVATVPKGSAAGTNATAGPDNAARAPRKKKGRSAGQRQPTPDSLRVHRWEDPLTIDGLPASGYYAERYYGPIIGPTCLLLLRSLDSRLATDSEGFTAAAADLASGIGCSSRGGANSQFWKAVRRCARFGLINQVEDQLRVRTELSPLTSRLAQRLPQPLRSEVKLWSDDRATLPPTSLLNGELPQQPLAPLAVLRLAARGLCTPTELRDLDRARKLR